MEERYPHKYPINDAIKRIENSLYDELMAIYNLGFKDGKNDVLDKINKIRAEIEELDGKYIIGDYATYGEHSPKYIQSMEVLQIIDKYKMELKIPVKWESEGYQ